MRTRAIPVSGVAIVVIAAASGVVASHPVIAQQPPAQPPPQVAPYRPPVIALVQPALGGTVPQDKPVLVFRFASAEPNDPIDAATFRVTVDGVDHTRHFQVTVGEGWGTLPEIDDDGDVRAPGPRSVVARICTTRGACAEIASIVTVSPSLTAATEAQRRSGSRRERVLDALLSAARKLLNP